jgi:hypothetical protein
MDKGRRTPAGARLSVEPHRRSIGRDLGKYFSIFKAEGLLDLARIRLISKSKLHYRGGATGCRMPPMLE